MELQERFLKYVSYDTQSSEESASYPSTDKQKALLSELRDEMQASLLYIVQLEYQKASVLLEVDAISAYS